MRRQLVLLVLVALSPILLFVNASTTDAASSSVLQSDCSDPGNDPADFILKNQGGENIDKANLQSALKLIPSGVKGVSYGDMFEWIAVTQNASSCFSKGKYTQGAQILAAHSVVFVGSGVLQESITALLGTNVVLPAEIFGGWAFSMADYINSAEINNQLVLYVAAVEACRENGESTSDCQDHISRYSSEGLSSYEFQGLVMFDSKGFLLQVDPPKQSDLGNVADVNSIDDRRREFPEYNDPSNMTSQQFYKGASVIYNFLDSRDSINKASSLISGDFQNDAADVFKQSSTAAQEPGQSSNFVEQFFSGVLNSVKSILAYFDFGSKTQPTLSYARTSDEDSHSQPQPSQVANTPPPVTQEAAVSNTLPPPVPNPVPPSVPKPNQKRASQAGSKSSLSLLDKDTAAQLILRDLKQDRTQWWTMDVDCDANGICSEADLTLYGAASTLKQAGLIISAKIVPTEQVQFAPAADPYLIKDSTGKITDIVESVPDNVIVKNVAPYSTSDSIYGNSCPSSDCFVVSYIVSYKETPFVQALSGDLLMRMHINEGFDKPTSKVSVIYSDHGCWKVDPSFDGIFVDMLKLCPGG